MTDNQGTVSYIIVNNVGGITSVTGNLIRFRGQDAPSQELILLNVEGNSNTVFTHQLLEGINQKTYHFDKNRNWYTAFKELKNELAPGPGVIVSNDLHDLIMLQAFNTGKKVVQIVHDGYNVQLALKFEEVVDKFIAHSRFFFDVLSQLLPHRRSDIVHLPYGIPISGYQKTPNTDRPLRLIFLGRMRESKGIFDLPLIQKYLTEKGIQANWTFIGSGPDKQKLVDQWASYEPARFEAPDSFNEVIKLCSDADIFVFPTHFEGFPVSLLETMSVGVVPVVSDLPGGIREIVSESTGIRCKMGDPISFANAIETLHHDRVLMQTLSHNCLQLVRTNFNAECQSPKYQAFFASCMQENSAPRHMSINKKIGSRLDQPWLPDFITKNLRKFYGSATGKRVNDSV
ncbi:MAG: hypothetical protein C5B59_14975 [Bacteroidetes bacterium]|nr:MAG: hypothetical protein C5B59_14975 [Bacteroidota bacterium]